MGAALRLNSGGRQSGSQSFGYRSISDWIDTVIEADPRKPLAQGTETTVGSYRRLNGTRIEEYSSTTGNVDVTDSEGSVFIPNVFFTPIRVTELKKATALTPASTAATVCYREDCE